MALADWILAAGVLAAFASGAAGAQTSVERSISVPARAQGQACAVLDGAAAAYASHPSEMTLWGDSRPYPYSIVISSPQQATGNAEIVAFRATGGSTQFDLRMPPGAYSSLRFEFARHDWVMHATVSAAEKVIVRDAVLFDLTGRGQETNTTVRLGERTDPLLHVTLDHRISRGELVRVLVPPSRAEQTEFTTVASAIPQRRGDSWVADFTVTENIPVERVSVFVAAGQDFRMPVKVTGLAALPHAVPDEVSGVVQRMHAQRGADTLETSESAFDAVLDDNANSAMQVQVQIDNAATANVQQVQLQMRRRELCFHAARGVRTWRLLYGPQGIGMITLDAPSRSLVDSGKAVVATLGPEQSARDFRFATVEQHRTISPLMLALLVFVGAGFALAWFLRLARIPHRRR